LRAWLEQVEAATEAEDLPAVVAWLASRDVPIEEDELRGAMRRSVLLVAAGGDPHRRLDLDGRAVTALAVELDTPARREELARALRRARAEADGLPGVSAAIDRLLADPELAWRAFAAGMIGAELAGD
jgi:hypothetical protein